MLSSILNIKKKRKDENDNCTGTLFPNLY